MATLDYTSTTWANGEDGATPINADRLNNIESGISNATTQINSNTTDIATINTNIADSGWITITSQIMCRKIYGTKFLWFSGKPVSSGNDTLVGSLPTGYRPVANYIFPLAIISDTFTKIFCTIKADGSILISSSASTVAYGIVAFV